MTLNQLRRKVLRHRRTSWRQHYKAMHVDLDVHRGGTIIDVLQELLQWNYVERTKEDVMITQAALSLLERGPSWH